MQSNYTFGIFLLTVNISAVVLLIFSIYFRLISAIKSRGKKELDFHFTLLMCSMVFMFANIIALYTGYRSYILHPDRVMSDLAPYRLADRTAMLLVAVCLLFIGRKIKGVIEENPD